MTAHTLHVRIIDKKNPETGSNANHIVEIANVFAAGALVDDLADWSYVYSYTGDFTFDIQHANRMGGDKSLVAHSSETPGEIVWYYRGLTDFEAVLYLLPTKGRSGAQRVLCLCRRPELGPCLSNSGRQPGQLGTICLPSERSGWRELCQMSTEAALALKESVSSSRVRSRGRKMRPGARGLFAPNCAGTSGRMLGQPH
jgi:hypothetical protein